MNDQVEEVKQKTDIVTIIGERVHLAKAGKHFKGLCPFHGEKTPSFTVSPELQIFKCFGCGESGDAYTFLEKFEGMEFYEALQYLANRAGIELKKDPTYERSEKAILYAINEQAAKFYHFLLTKHSSGKNALEYVKTKRQINEGSIETFTIGYAPILTNALFRYLTKKKKFSAEMIEKAGLAANYNGRWVDRFRGRVTFPIYDNRGNCIAMAGRILPEYDKPNLGKYINSPETPIYHKSTNLYGLSITRQFIKKLGYAVIVEGELDLISSWQVGVQNIVAIKGSALTADQAKLLARLVKKVVLCLDSDFAGNAAAIRGIRIIQEIGLEISVAKLEGYKDPDEAARGNAESLKQSILDAVNIWDFIIDSTLSAIELETGAEKGAASKKVVPILAEIPDRIVQAYYIKRVSEKLRVPYEAVLEEVTRQSRADNKPVPTALIEIRDKKDNRREILENRLVATIFQKDAKLLLEEKYNSLLASPYNKKIYALLREYFNKYSKFSAASFLKTIPAEMKSNFSDIIIQNDESNDDELIKEIEGTRREIEVYEIKRNLLLLVSQMEQFEADGDEAKLKETQQQFTLLTRKLSGLDLA